MLLASYAVILFFTCGNGCGTPPNVTLPERYPTLAPCQTAGKAWLAPAANPQKAVSGYVCRDQAVKAKRPK